MKASATASAAAVTAKGGSAARAVSVRTAEGEPGFRWSTQLIEVRMLLILASRAYEAS
jgi:hypothetical protein